MPGSKSGSVFSQPTRTDALDINTPVHHAPNGFSDRFALGFTKLLGLSADTFFCQALLPLAQSSSKRWRQYPAWSVRRLPIFRVCAAWLMMMGGIRTLLEEAENERMHLMTFIKIAQRMAFERLAVLLAQWIFYIAFFALYLLSSRTTHRVLGYFEEEAVLSYTLYLKEIDEGRSPNVAAPDIAKHYWKLPADAILRDVVIVVRAEEAHHRDVNHGLASTLAGVPVDQAHAAAYPQHASDVRMDA